MRPTLSLTLLLAAAQQATAQFYIDYFYAGTRGCVGNRRTCNNIPSGTCCLLGEYVGFFDDARTGSYGPAGFTVWANTDDHGTYCGACRTTSGLGCWRNYSPFETAFIVAVPRSCRAGVLRQATIDASGTTTELTAGDGEAAEGCTAFTLPNVLGYNGQDYAITDENRKEIEADFHIGSTSTKAKGFDFAAKWKSALIGPTVELHQGRVGEAAQTKPDAI